jgi:hypothetical protein
MVVETKRDGDEWTVEDNGEKKGGIKCNRQVPTTSHKLVCAHSNLSADVLASNI